MSCKLTLKYLRDKDNLTGFYSTLFLMIWIFPLFLMDRKTCLCVKEGVLGVTLKYDSVRGIRCHSSIQPPMSTRLLLLTIRRENVDGRPNLKQTTTLQH